jgi:predicted dinucleotide-binding enzyme
MTMKIGVLGAGMMSEALAGPWVRAGHEVLIGGRTPDKAAELARRIGARSGSLREAAEFGEVVLLAVRQDGVARTLEEAGAGVGSLAGKTLIDCGNSVDVTDFSLVTWDGRSIAEEARRLAPGSFVVKAFNMAHAEVWREPRDVDGRPFAVPFAGDEEGKEAVVRLIADLGCTPLDAGDLTQARHLEAAAIIVIRQLFCGAAPHSVFAWVSEGRSGGAVSRRQE